MSNAGQSSDANDQLGSVEEERPTTASDEQDKAGDFDAEGLKEAEAMADDEDEASVKQLQEMLDQQEKMAREKGNAVDPSQNNDDEPEDVPAPLGENQLNQDEAEARMKELLEDVPEEKRKEWIDAIVFQGEIIEQVDFADGLATATFRVRTGEDALDLSQMPSDLAGDNPDLAVQHINTKMTLHRLAIVTQRINGESIGNSVEKREQWLSDRPGPFSSRLNEKYNELELKIKSVLRAGDLKNGSGDVTHG